MACEAADPPPCQICGTRAHIYWAPFTLCHPQLEVEPVMPWEYGHIILCRQHFDSLIEAVKEWARGLDIRDG